MTLTELRYIVAVAREHHFGRAAGMCFVSQPTLSVAVRKLESELGVTLFERGPTEVKVTAIGRRVVEQAQRVLEDADTVRQIAAHGQNELAGMLRLGVIYTIGPYVLPHLIPLLRRKAPQMPLQIEENYTAVLSERLKQGKLDLIILSLPFEEPGIATEAIYEEPFVVLMPAGHRLERKQQVATSDLSHEDLLLLGPGHCFRDQVLRACPECNRASVPSDNIQKTLEGSSLETIRLMVVSGMGITVLPQTSIDDYSYPKDLLSVRPFSQPEPRRTVALAWRKRFPRLEAIRVIADTVRTCALENGVNIIDQPA